MACTLGFGLVVLLLAVLGEGYTRNIRSICHPFSESDLQSSKCSSRDQHYSNVAGLDNDLKDAAGQEHMLIYVANTTVEMYKFLNPCLSTAEAALALFYHGAAEPDQDWLSAMTAVVESTPVVGRRRRDSSPANSIPHIHYLTETEMLRAQLTDIVRHHKVACIQWLVEKYANTAFIAWKTAHPDFFPPTTTITTITTTVTTPKPQTTTTSKMTTSEPTTTTTITATPEPRTTTTATTTTEPRTTKMTNPTTSTTSTTTTTMPTTTTTREPTTAEAVEQEMLAATTTPTTPTTTAASPASTTSSAAEEGTSLSRAEEQSQLSTQDVKTSQAPSGQEVRCVVCSGIGCLIDPGEVACTDNQFFCMTSVIDSPEGRQINRQCADEPSCEELYLGQTVENEACYTVDNTILRYDNACHFCCRGDSCNRPPRLTPPASTLFMGQR